MLDQAAGLRRRKLAAPPHCILGLFESGASARQLVLALHARGQTQLLVDATGRLQSDAPRSLFDWRQQLARGQLHACTQPYGDDWHAPGVAVDALGLSDVAQRYAAVVFDLGLRPGRLALMRGARHSAVVEVGASQDAMQHSYVLLKTLAHAHGINQIGLIGDVDACTRVSEACARFLGGGGAPEVHCVAGEDEPFAALAVRMAGEERAHGPATKQENP